MEVLFILKKIARVILMVILFFLIAIQLLTEEQFTLESIHQHFFNLII